MNHQHPQANVHWKTARDLFCAVRFIEGRGYYVATMSNGDERVCFWHGREAKHAQDKQPKGVRHEHPQQPQQPTNQQPTQR